MMEQYKLCWYHKDYYGVPKDQICSNCSECNADVLPTCHNGCKTYTRCCRAFRMSGIPDKFWYLPNPTYNIKEDIDANRILKQLRTNINSFVSSGMNLFIYSNVSGNGKTFRSCILGNSLIKSHANDLKVNDNLLKYVDILEYVYKYDVYDKLSFDNQTRINFFNSISTLDKSDLVIWDNLGSNTDTKFEKVIVRSIINNRINFQKSNIFISSRSPQELSSIIGRNDCDKVIKSSISIELHGESFRERSVNKFMSELR